MNESARRFSPLQVLGVVAALVSVVLAFEPTLVNDPGPAPDLFEAIERHVRWGLGIGLGGILVAKRWRRPWSVLIAWVVFALSAGYLLARFVGMARVGWGNEKQWILVGVELVLCGVAAFWIHRKRAVANRP